MPRLTHRRSDRADAKYLTAESKYKIVQKLGAIEDQFGDLADDICLKYCKYSSHMDSAMAERLCNDCPVGRLHDLIIER